ncbi:MAG: heme-binding protein [Burkholderiales bacterium]|nr:heme-binding protein [Burkholderiales bacterium]
MFTGSLRRRVAPGFAFVVALLALPMPAFATPEPDHVVVRRLGDIELRDYAGYTVAEVVVPGPADAAGNQAFGLLFGYISGRNQAQRKLEMTVPVTQAVAGPIDAAAAVTQPAADGRFVVQFVLPRGVRLDNAPPPSDPRVTLRDVPPRRVAAVRYSGVWSAPDHVQHIARLESALRDAGIAWSGPPVYARYNSPFTPGFMRRNEIWLDVR